MAARIDHTEPGPAGPRARPFASAWRRAHLTADERMARGKAARAETPRSADQDERDYQAFAAAVQAGRLTAGTGV